MPYQTIFLVFLIVIATGCKKHSSVGIWSDGEDYPKNYFPLDERETGILILISTQWAGHVNKIYKDTIHFHYEILASKGIRLLEYDVSIPAHENYTSAILKENEINFLPVLLFSGDGVNWSSSRSPNEIGLENIDFRSRLVGEVDRVLNTGNQ